MNTHTFFVSFISIIWYNFLAFKCLHHKSNAEEITPSILHGFVCIFNSFCSFFYILGINNVDFHGKTLSYVKYMEWTVCSPIMVTQMCMGYGLPPSITFPLAVYTAAFCVCGILGALAEPLWIKILFTCEGSAYCIIVLYRLWMSAKACDPERIESRSAKVNFVMACLLWPMYVVTWGLGSDVYGLISSDCEFWIETGMSLALKTTAMTYVFSELQDAKSRSVIDFLCRLLRVSVNSANHMTEGLP